MITAQGPALLEFNVRLGDPEAQAILPRLGDGEFLRLCQAVARGTLRGLRPRVDPRPTCALTLCAAGYPEAPRTGDTIAVDESALPADSWLVYAGVRSGADGLRTSGGRVLSVVARGDTPAAARALAYRAIGALRFADMHHRTDIGL
jgi:phosphoribosylamine--glycine ligase